MSPIPSAPTIRCAAWSTLMGALMDEPLDNGTAHFGPSNLEFTSIDVGNPTVNLIPAEARARFNIRFNDSHTPGVAARADREPRRRTPRGEHIRWHIEWEPSNADAFLAPPGPFIDLVGRRDREVTGRTPALSTSGGTSDARFIKDYCPVIEFGLVGQHHAPGRRAHAGRRPRGAHRGVSADPGVVFRIRRAPFKALSLIPAFWARSSHLAMSAIDERREQPRACSARARRPARRAAVLASASASTRRGVGADLARRSRAASRPARTSRTSRATSSSASPVSAMVGKSGNSAERAAPVVPIMRSVPAAMCGVTTSAGENSMSMRPPSRSVTAGPVPRYGTCSMSMPAIWREQRAGKMRGRAGAGRAVRQLAGIGLGVGDQLGGVLRRHRRIDHQDVGRRRDRARPARVRA